MFFVYQIAHKNFSMANSSDNKISIFEQIIDILGWYMRESWY
jgi:hypothetical protein